MKELESIFLQKQCLLIAKIALQFKQLPGVF